MFLVSLLPSSCYNPNYNKPLYKLILSVSDFISGEPSCGHLWLVRCTWPIPAATMQNRRSTNNMLAESAHRSQLSCLFSLAILYIQLVYFILFPALRIENPNATVLFASADCITLNNNTWHTYHRSAVCSIM